MMESYSSDQSVLARIQALVEKTHQLQSQPEIVGAEQSHLHEVRAELEQCWDLLRQRRALRSAGHDPDQAKVRPREVVEKYRQ